MVSDVIGKLTGSFGGSSVVGGEPHARHVGLTASTQISFLKFAFGIPQADVARVTAHRQRQIELTPRRVHRQPGSDGSQCTSERVTYKFS